jgi:hypothetical protein
LADIRLFLLKRTRICAKYAKSVRRRQEEIGLMAPEEKVDHINDWLKTYRIGGIKIGDTFAEIKSFAFDFFDVLDADGDGFLTDQELEDAFEKNGFDLRQKAFITFLLRRIDDIESTYQEEWADGRKGISLVDLQEYFATPHL